MVPPRSQCGGAVPATTDPAAPANCPLPNLQVSHWVAAASMVRAVKVVPLADDGYGAGGARSFGGGSGGASAGSAGRGRLMGKVPSLVFDVDDLGEAAQHAHVEPLDEGSVAEVQQKLQALLEPWSEPGGCSLPPAASRPAAALPAASASQAPSQAAVLECSLHAAAGCSIVLRS
jgi:hypothetical protein